LDLVGRRRLSRLKLLLGRVLAILDSVPHYSLIWRGFIDGNVDVGHLAVWTRGLIWRIRYRHHERFLLGVAIIPVVQNALCDFFEADTIDLMADWEVLEEDFLVDPCHVHAGMLWKPGHLLFLIYRIYDWSLTKFGGTPVSIEAK
jgi:hypothetical protein